MRSPLKRIFIALVVLTLFASSALAEGTSGEQKLSLTTGLPTEKAYKPVQITFDNEPGARPQLGMSHADVVYEFECYTGGYTRYLAIYNDDVPENRRGLPLHPRARAGDVLELRRRAGALRRLEPRKADVNAYIANLKVDAQFDGIKVDPHYHRDKKRKMPHNAVAELQNMLADTPEVAERQMLTFSADSPPSRARTRRRSPFPSARGTFPPLNTTPTASCTAISSTASR
jgi:hypothetical protein